MSHCIQYRSYLYAFKQLDNGYVRVHVKSIHGYQNR